MSAKPWEPGTSDRPALDRRAFLGNMGVVAGVAIAASAMPLAAARAASFGAPVVAAPVLAPIAPASADELRNVDDMWGHWPRYAHPIPYARVPPSSATWEQVDPADRMLVI